MQYDKLILGFSHIKESKDAMEKNNQHQEVGLCNSFSLFQL